MQTWCPAAKLALPGWIPASAFLEDLFIVTRNGLFCLAMAKNGRQRIWKKHYKGMFIWRIIKRQTLGATHWNRKVKKLVFTCNWESVFQLQNWLDTSKNLTPTAFMVKSAGMVIRVLSGVILNNAFQKSLRLFKTSYRDEDYGAVPMQWS